MLEFKAGIVEHDPEGPTVVAPRQRDDHQTTDLVGRVADRVSGAYQVRLLSYLLAGWRATRRRYRCRGCVASPSPA
jgi:hypothetical protein